MGKVIWVTYDCHHFKTVLQKTYGTQTYFIMEKQYNKNTQFPYRISISVSNMARYTIHMVIYMFSIFFATWYVAFSRPDTTQNLLGLFNNFLLRLNLIRF